MFSTPLRRVFAASALLLCLGIVFFADERREAPPFLPHGFCFTWDPALMWTHVVSDTLIGLAYISIPTTLLHLVRKRADMPFDWIVMLFATFIVSCGATHWIEVWTVWHPDYWLSGAVKAITALASVSTAAALASLVPRLLAIPTAAQVAATREALEKEVRHRRLAEDELRAERAELEHRVRERTQQLAIASAAAQAATTSAEEANRQKDRFLAKVSHELRTPLQSTLTWANVLSLSADDPQRAAIAAQRIVHNVSVQARLIDDLLDISRILSGKLQLEWQRADPVQVVGHAVDVVRDVARRRAVEIEWTSRSSVESLATDPARLEQVAWNLLSNAVQASEPGTRVRAALEVGAAGVRLEVQDWGCGIAAAELPLLFEPFLQRGLDANRHRGLGLGLAIVHNIVTLFGGDIRVHSGGPGRGALFVVRLPAASDSGPAALPATRAQALRPEELERLRGLRVLYVEDEPELGEGTRLLLSAHGAEVILCERWEEARDAIAGRRFDVLLTDLRLDDDRSGLELMPLLRAHGHRVPALIVSAFGTAADRAASRAAGFVAHLVKPLGADELARALLDAIAPEAAG
jgi:signal transduction histidine kinase/ActR/RegA family two-component response regulator